MKTCFTLNQWKCFVGLALFACTSSFATAAGPEIVNPAPLRPRGTEPLRPEAARVLKSKAPLPAAVSGDVTYDLNITYTQSQLWNPTENRFDVVKLRNYVGGGVDPKVPYVAPLVEVYPGQTVRMTLHNNLSADPTCGTGGGSANSPHCFNGTNLHTHGLWINPAGNSDNVMISVNPGVTFPYEYNIPPDHPAGTFWYHSHRHGSTALQVSSGMAGPIIVRGTRPPTRTANGDLDELLKPTSAQSFLERVLVFQQIQYACRDAKGNIEKNSDGTYACKSGEVGGVEDYDQFGPGTWPASGRFTSINGAVLGQIPNAKLAGLNAGA